MLVCVCICVRVTLGGTGLLGGGWRDEILAMVEQEKVEERKRVALVIVV